MNIFELFAVLIISISSVRAIALLPSLQGTNWFSGQVVTIQAVQSTDNDGNFYNAYLRSNDIREQVLFEAPYGKYTSFVVPDVFSNVGGATLYVVAQGNTGQDNMRVVIYNNYDYNQMFPRISRGNNNVFIGCAGCRF